MNSALNRIIGYRRNGCPIWEIRGGSQGSFEQSGQQGGDQGGDLDLLGDGGDNDNGDTGGNDDGGDGGQGGDQGNLAQQIAQAVAAAMGPVQQQFQSELDRRIGQLTNRRNQGQGNGQGGGQQQNQPAAGPNPSDIRDARSAYRDALSDSGIRFSPEERDFVNAGLQGQLAAALAADPDVDRAGTAVARQVETTVKGLRKHYQDRLLKQLQQRGAIDMTKLQSRTANPSSPATSTTPAADFQKGAQTADALLAARGRGPVEPVK